jgi:hypothetical protein
MHTDPIAAMSCLANDTTCPTNTVDLGNGTLTFTLRQDVGTSYFVGSPKLRAGASGLFVSHPRFESWPEGQSEPTPHPDDPNATTDVNLTANTETVLTPTSITGTRLAFSYDAIGPKQ